MNMRIFNTSVLAIALFSVFSSFAMGMETLRINNQTDIPMFINVGKGSFYVAPNGNNIFNIEKSWTVNPDTASTFPTILEYTLSTDIGAPPFGTTKFLVNNDELKVILNIGSYNKIYDFVMPDTGDFWYITTLAGDNFEKSTFALYTLTPDKKGLQILSLEEQAEKMQQQKMGIEQGRLLGTSGMEQMIQKREYEKLLPLLPRR